MHLAVENQFDRLPPHSLDAERCLIASMLLSAGENKVLFTSTRCLVNREDFFQVDHQIFFDVICQTVDQKHTIDALILREELIKRGQLDECGGVAYIGMILNSVPSAAHGPHYAGIVAEKSALRRVIATSNEMIRRAYSGADSSEVFQWGIDALATQHATGKTEEAVLLESALHEAYEDATGEGVPMYPLPFEFLNDWLGGGVCKRDFVIVAGWPSHGKSAICKQFGEFLAAKGHPGGIVSLEESRKKIARNLLSGQSGINNRDLRRGRINAQQAADLADAVSALSSHKLYIHDSTQTLAQVITAVDLGVARQKWEWVVIDHLDLINAGAFSSSENETTRHNAISMTFKHLARRLDIPVFAVKQLKKRGTAIRKPSPDDLRASGAYHADADIVLFVDSDDVHNRENPNWNATGMTSVIGSKVREGTGGIRSVAWDGRTQRYQGTREQPPMNFDPFQ